MEVKFDFSALLKHHEKRHKGKPTQFSSVAGGVKKRLENNLKYRKSSRLTDFDNFRNLEICPSPAPVPKAQLKIEHRRQQLEKWKEEKEKRKKEEVTQKKKPFLTGVPHNPLKFVPPPPPKPMPSTSGRVTRSQTARNNVSKTKKKNDKDSKQTDSQSFAPRNASFKPPQLKNMTKVPPLALNKPRKPSKCNITFDPILPVNEKELRQTRSRTGNNTVVNGTAHNKQTESTKGKSTKQNTRVAKMSKRIPQSTSSSDQQSITSSSESDHNRSPILNRPTRKSICTEPVTSATIIKNTPRKSLQKTSRQTTPKNPVPKSESSSEEKLRSPKSPVEGPRTPEQIVAEANKFSPCVTKSRGKDNARKEMKKKMEEGLLDEDASDAEAVAHFRRQVASEVERLSGICRDWEAVSATNVLPEPVQEAILGAVGQARLLMSQKLVQFSSLVDRCARGDTGQALVTCADLHGFWDMVFMQVVNVDMRFRKLHEMRAREWAEEPLEVVKKVAKPLVKKPVKPAGGNSRLKEMIAAARKAKKAQKEQAKSPAKSSASANLDLPSKTFEAGFFCVKSPVRSPILGTPRNKSLLKAVLSSEAKKASASKNSASFAMLRASVMGKNVEYDGIAPLPQTPLTPINLDATPARSILKSTNLKSAKKSIKVVLFDQSDELQEPFSPTDDSNKNDIKETDSGISSMDQDPDQNKENSKRKSKLLRQDATEVSPVMTRSRRKSLQTPDVSSEEGKTKRSGRKKKALQETENVKEVETPKKSSRRRKSELQSLLE